MFLVLSGQLPLRSNLRWKRLDGWRMISHSKVKIGISARSMQERDIGPKETLPERKRIFGGDMQWRLHCADIWRS